MRDLHSKVEFFSKALTSVYDTHAPYRTFTKKKRTTPWITTSIKRLITLRNKAWRNFKRDGSATARASYKLLRNHVQTVLRNAKHEYFKQKLSNCKNSNELWKIVNGLGINDTSDDKELPFDADTFNAHFVTTTNLGPLHDTRPTVRNSA